MRAITLAAVVPAALILTALTGCAPQPSGEITPIVASAGISPDDATYMQAYGAISGVSEDGGKCSFTFYAITGAATRLTTTGKAAGDHTTCGPVEEAIGFLIGGTYSVDLKYVSLAGQEYHSERFEMILPTPTEIR